MNGKVCEVCGKEATSFVRDVKEVIGDDDDLFSSYRQYAPDGDLHFYCSDHHRESVTRDLSLVAKMSAMITKR